jgi:hypothetical protein
MRRLLSDLISEYGHKIKALTDLYDEFKQRAAIEESYAIEALASRASKDAVRTAKILARQKFTNSQKAKEIIDDQIFLERQIQVLQGAILIEQNSILLDRVGDITILLDRVGDISILLNRIGDSKGAVQHD